MFLKVNNKKDYTGADIHSCPSFQWVTTIQTSAKCPRVLSYTDWVSPASVPI